MKQLFTILISIYVLLNGACSCSCWHQSETLLTHIDSLSRGENTHYCDTSALQMVIQTWDRPLIRMLKHNDLGLAYYYLGRSYEDCYQNYSAAADAYIRSEQLYMSDPTMRGRIKSSILNIYSHTSDSLLILELAQSALKDYRQSGDSILIAHGMLNIAQLYRVRRQYHRVDSLLSLIETINLDSTTLIRFNMQRGYYFYDLKQYDSAVSYFNRALNISRFQKDEEYSYHMLMKSHYRLHHLDSAAHYANILVEYKAPLLRADAYYTLIEKARIDGDAERVAKYAHLRADMQQEMKLNANKRSIGISKIQQHYENKKKSLRYIIITIVAFCLLACIISLIAYHYLQRLTQAQQEVYLREQQIQEMEVQDMQRRKSKRDAMETNINKHYSDFTFDSKIWRDDQRLCTKIDECMFNLYTRLHQQYKVDTQDIKICVLTLYGASRIEVANCIVRAVSSVPKLRSNTAKKMGVTYPQLRDFLLDYMAS